MRTAIKIFKLKSLVGAKGQKCRMYCRNSRFLGVRPGDKQIFCHVFYFCSIHISRQDKPEPVASVSIYIKNKNKTMGLQAWP
ncbi:hypothetical protein ZOSMA_47G00260 [Zostera marina]|uniref:Uncharacterized protein n=1 Tax=Zostera marina TaxID=29655 RepID=A0A0K9NZJ5_ZOSMR|nr:hypothetical protein ZOSMA_47G00260 [Zostera marina]